MFGTHFYHEKTKKCVAIFGRLFNNIYVIRKNSNGKVISQLKVPLSYAPKAKYLERIRENPDLSQDTRVAIKLPRMSFEITSINYDTTRQLSKLSNFTNTSTNNLSRQKFNTAVPYVIGFQLNAYAKNQDDALQIVEQILPTFNPQYTLTIKPFMTEHPTFKEDIPISIAGVGFTDDYEGDLGSRRTIIYSLDFEMRTNFYSNIPTSKIIRRSVSKIFNPRFGIIDSSIGITVDSDVRLQTVQIDPNPITTIGNPDSNFGFTTTIWGQDSDGGFGN
tara:strand:+ start:1779 stop:2606 length:828 start_codon:yes stop_codon:yes gene_type:complete